MSRRACAGAGRRPLDGILLLDKPLGVSSNEALQRARRLFRAEKAGHTGSLDPLASGLLPICFGQATKLCGLLLDGAKRYIAEVRLGARTATGDAEGEVVARSDPTGLTREQVQAALRRFVGPSLQVPPMYSALKHQGRPLYALAREGVEIERQARPVVIEALELLEFTPAGFRMDVRCSKGTYIRTLAEDIAAALGQQAHLGALRRVGADPFDARELVSLDTLTQAAEQDPAALDRHLLPLLRALAGWPQYRASAAELALLRRGIAIAVEPPEPGAERIAIVDEQSVLVGLAGMTPQGRLQPRRWLA